MPRQFQSSLHPDDPYYYQDDIPIRKGRNFNLNIHAPFCSPEFICDINVWQDGLLDPTVPKPDIVFKYKNDENGPWLGLDSIELRVLTPDLKTNTCYKVLLPRWVIKECERLYVDKKRFPDLKNIEKYWECFHSLWVCFNLDAFGPINDADGFFQILEKAISTNHFMISDYEPIARPWCPKHNWSCSYPHEGCHGWGPRRVFWMEMYGWFGDLYRIQMDSEGNRRGEKSPDAIAELKAWPRLEYLPLNDIAVPAIKKHIRLLRQLYQRGDLRIGRETPVEEKTSVNPHAPEGMVFPKGQLEGPILHGTGYLLKISHPFDLEFPGVSMYPKSYGWTLKDPAEIPAEKKIEKKIKKKIEKTVTLKEKVKHFLPGHKEHRIRNACYHHDSDLRMTSGCPSYQYLGQLSLSYTSLV